MRCEDGHDDAAYVLGALSPGERQVYEKHLATCSFCREAVADLARVPDLLDRLDAEHPLLGRRIRDETGAVRRFVNVYVDGDDVRFEQGLATTVGDGTVIQVLPSVAGG